MMMFYCELFEEKSFYQKEYFLLEEIDVSRVKAKKDVCRNPVLTITLFLVVFI